MAAVRQLALLDDLDDATVSVFRPRRRELPDPEVEVVLSKPVGEMDYDPRWCRPLGGRRVEIIEDERLS